MARPGRRAGPGRAAPRHSGRRFAGIRFRLGVALAAALAPILLLGAFQAASDFELQAEQRRDALRLAVERSAATSRARLDGAVVLLETLRPDALGDYCTPRLAALADRLTGYEQVLRVRADGAIGCGLDDGTTAPTVVDQAWFARLRDGAEVVTLRAPATLNADPAMVVGVRATRPLGGFDGALAAVIALDALRPDVSDPALPAGAEAALTDAAGQVLVATRPEPFRLRGEALGPRLGQLHGREVFAARDVSGDQRIYAAAPVIGGDVFIVLSASNPGPLSWARLNPMSAVVLPLLAWLAAFGATMWVSERLVVRWLAYLERVAAIYARGRFKVRPVQIGEAPLEIRALGEALSDMADGIDRRDRSLTDSLAEKDALLREVHHRVKNNLQIISSLLSMQQRALEDPAAKAALADTRQRISALALIYRTLYQSNDIRQADLREFLTDLVGQLIASESGRGPVVTSLVEADSLVADPDKLAPLALWLVEAVSNAQKHAFAGRGGRLEVRFRVLGPTSVLEVRDDGPGAPVDRLTPGVGSTLMQAFARQLRGEMTLEAPEGGGVLARLVFPTPEALRPIDPRDLAGPGPKSEPELDAVKPGSDFGPA
ncbi:MAG TPA: histidine kinase dimerization/phosphoacceptor domain -containing protein [Brevundimonas sp.]|jgi:two-component sensor histidine kinase|uniref:sensor histidine kinase PhyK n=1 Tax=Brevundimonas sp. TaxID=1871086 RepID=UPI002E0FBC75|nr:histidine kinase dimerization/phosphoacceptor domain -containing protein [Brevundimonas sp.]